MSLDIPTLVLVLTLISLTLAVSVLYVAGSARSEDGLATWGWGLLLYAASFPAFLLRMAGWPMVSILGSNLLVAATLAVQTLALGRFQQGRGAVVPRWLVWGPVALTAVAAGLLLDHHQGRALATSALLVLVAGVQTWQAWSPGFEGGRERGRMLLTAGSAMLVLLAAMRLAMILRATDWSGDAMVPEVVLAASYLMTVSVVLLNTMGFVLMQKERAVALQLAQATHDPLTGAANRRALNTELDRGISLATRSGQPLSLLMLDIDWFKKVNDAWGHQAGDGVLRGLAQRLQERLRRQDFLARFGGEEFVVVLPDTTPEGALVVAEGLRRAVADQPFAVEGRDIAITVSLGVGTALPSGVAGTADRLIGAADHALYLAKAKGRNRVEAGTREESMAPVDRGAASD